MIRDQVVVAGFFQALACCKVSLPDGVGAPQAAFLCVFVLLVGSGLLRVGVEPIRSGEPAFFIGFGHQGAFAVDVVGGAACCALRDSLGNSSPKGVVAVLDGEAICAVPDFAESACCVVAPVSFPACAGFLDEVAQRVVAGADLFGLALLRGGVFVERTGVLQQLVGFVVGPRSGLVGAAQAVACGVPAVGLLGQAQGLQCLVWIGLAQAVQRVVAIAGLP